MDPQAVDYLKRADPVMARIIEQVGECRFGARRDGTHFHHLLRAIVYQQLSGSAAQTIHGRVIALFPDQQPTGEGFLGLSDDTLRGAGLSRQKIGYLRDLSARVASGEVPLDTLDSLDDDAIMEALTRVKGIGRWTAQMFLMFRLGRPDVLPELDLGVRKAIQRAYRLRSLPTTERVQQVGAAWRPYASIASWYLWRSLELDDTPTAKPASQRKSAPKRKAAPRAKSASKRKPAAKRRAAAGPRARAARSGRPRTVSSRRKRRA